MRAYDRIYAFSPNIWLEEVKARNTGRHPCEFYKLDLEVNNASIEQIMTLFEGYYTELINRIKKACAEILEKNQRKI